MDFEFADRELQRLYETGKSRKYKLQKHLIEKFVMRIDQIRAAHTIHDLWHTPALNFEKMHGFANRYSVRVQKKSRIEVEVSWQDEKKTRGSFLILRLSQHYED